MQKRNETHPARLYGHTIVKAIKEGIKHRPRKTVAEVVEQWSKNVVK